MHDIVIRGGTIIDGTGKAAFTGDVAITGGRIAAVGGKQGPARREIDADGLLVTPGWVDVHTHYDGQAMWDPLLAPSCWHGVTTVMFGNCGVGFAPVKKHHRGALMDLMEGVEEIPNPVLSDRKSTRLNSSHTVISPLSLHDALPIWSRPAGSMCTRITTDRRCGIRCSHLLAGTALPQ